MSLHPPAETNDFEYGMLYGGRGGRSFAISTTAYWQKYEYIHKHLQVPHRSSRHHLLLRQSRVGLRPCQGGITRNSLLDAKCMILATRSVSRPTGAHLSSESEMSAAFAKLCRFVWRRTTAAAGSRHRYSESAAMIGCRACRHPSPFSTTINYSWCRGTLNSRCMPSRCLLRSGGGGSGRGMIGFCCRPPHFMFSFSLDLSGLF